MRILVVSAAVLIGLLSTADAALARQCVPPPASDTPNRLRPNTRYDYRIAPGTRQADAIRLALSEWQRALRAAGMGSQFSFSEIGAGSSTRRPVIDISNGTPTLNKVPRPDLGATANYDWNGASRNEVTAIRVVFNADSLVMANDPVAYFALMLHEMIHPMGFANSSNPASVSYDGTGPRPLSVPPCDASAVATRSGVAPTPPPGGPVAGGCPPGGCDGPPLGWSCASGFGYLYDYGFCFPSERGGGGSSIYTDWDWRFLTTGPKAPLVRITAPSSGTVLSAPGSGTLAVDTLDPDGAITRVDYFAAWHDASGNYVPWQYVASSYAYPFSLPFSGIAPGQYYVVARAWDRDNYYSDSGQIVLSVQASSAQTYTTLSPWQRIYSGQRLYSPNQQYFLEHQWGDGHLVAYVANGGPYWASGLPVGGGNGYTEMDGGTGNFVSYGPSGVPGWSTNTTSPGSTLRLYNSGVIEVVSGSGIRICTVTNMSWGSQWCPP